MGGKAALFRGDHWAVRVGEYGFDCYEVQQDKKTLSITSTKEMDTGFLDQRGRVGEDGSESGELCSDIEMQTARPIRGTLTLSGVTAGRMRRYWISLVIGTEDTRSTICSAPIVRSLLGTLFNFWWEALASPPALPQASVGSWQCNSGHFKAKSKHIGFKVSKWSSGKAGAIWGVFGVEAEGPKVAKGLFSRHHFGNLGPLAEASLFRLEAKCLPIRFRLEPNLNSGIGLKDGEDWRIWIQPWQ